MNEEYFEWLLSKAQVDDGENGYRLLCGILHEVIFYPIVEMDDNRWQDGIEYRYEFAGDEQGDILSKSLGGCTMLELMLSLAEKTAFDMEGSVFEAGIGRWFTELLENTGLDLYTDSELMNSESAYFEVENILENIIFRRYRYNGEGGFYPLRDPEEDQRETELEMQRNHYLMENYDIFGG